MNVTKDIAITRSKESIWQAITDIENSGRMISSILKINILERPKDDLVGLKWQETREMFGKEATETMWITDAETNEYYFTRAESHGSVYITKLSLGDSASGTLLKMSFRGEPQTFLAKLMSLLLMPFIKASIEKALVKDLQDIKNFVERNC